MFPEPNPTDDIAAMKRMADLLIPYSFPNRDSECETDITPLKQRELVIDGWQVVLHLGKADYREFTLEAARMYSRHSTFLPFTMICKVAVMCLGTDRLNLIELMYSQADGVQDEQCRKIYVWSVYKDKEGNAIPHPLVRGLPASYDGLDFVVLDHTDQQ